MPSFDTASTWQLQTLGGGLALLPLAFAGAFFNGELSHTVNPATGAAIITDTAPLGEVLMDRSVVEYVMMAWIAFSLVVQAVVSGPVCARIIVFLSCFSIHVEGNTGW